MVRITLKNDFHDTEVVLYVRDDKLTRGQIHKAWKTLCGVDSCRCSDDLGCRGEQEVHLRLSWNHETGLSVRVCEEQDKGTPAE